MKAKVAEIGRQQRALQTLIDRQQEEIEILKVRMCTLYCINYGEITKPMI